MPLTRVDVTFVGDLADVLAVDAHRRPWDVREDAHAAVGHALELFAERDVLADADLDVALDALVAVANTVSPVVWGEA